MAPWLFGMMTLDGGSDRKIGPLIPSPGDSVVVAGKRTNHIW